MDIGKAIKFPFKGEHAWANLGCMALCLLIPVVGGIVAGGYRVVIDKKLIENLDADAPRFSFQRFSDYLIRGVWPFLVGMLMVLCLVPFVLVAWAMTIAGFLLVDRSVGWGIALIIIGVCLYLLSFLLFAPVLAPMQFKAGLEGKFEAAFDVAYLSDYWKRVGLLTIGAHFLLVILMVPAMLVSMCVPYLGLFALITLMMFVTAHWNTQLYLEYLRRGGIAVAFTPEPIEPGFEVVLHKPNA